MTDRIFYKFLLVTVLSCYALVIMTAELAAQQLITQLSKQKITIDSNFTGARILLFGTLKNNRLITKKNPTDIIVIVRGPLVAFDIAQKKNIAGIWLNAEKKHIEKAPSYYAVLSNRKLDDIADKKILRHYGIGLDETQIHFEAQDKNSPDPKGILQSKQEYRDAFIRLLAKKGQYHSDSASIEIIDDTLFHTSLNLPNDAYEGKYLVETYLFSDGNLIHSTGRSLVLEKSSIQRFFFNLSKKHPLAYGLLALLISLAVGLLMGLIFARKKY